MPYFSDGLKVSVIHWAGLAQSPGEVVFPLWFPIIALISLALGLLVFYGVEKPSVDVGKRLIRRLEPGKVV